MADIFEIAGRIHSTSQEEVVTVADEILDSNKNKKQSQINSEVETRLNAYETGKFVNVETYAELPASGEVDTIYRVANWDGEQVDTTKYAEYSWDGTQYVLLGVNKNDDVIRTDVSQSLSDAEKKQARENLGMGNGDFAVASDFTNPDSTKRAKVTTVGAVLDGMNDGVYDVSKRNPTAGPNSDGKFTLEYILNNANTLIPTSRRHGGMIISFVDSSDNKYVQFRCMAQNFTTDVTQWQGVDDEPTPESDNMVKSGGVANGFAIILGEEAKTIDLSSYEADSGTVDPDTMIYRNDYGYGNHRYKVIPIVAGRTIRVTPISTSIFAVVIPMKDNVFVNETIVNVCDGITSVDRLLQPTDIEIPSDAKYLYVYTRDSSEVSHEPTIKYLAVEGLIEKLQNEKLDANQGANNEGKILGIDSTGNVIPVNDLGYECKEELNGVENVVNGIKNQINNINDVVFSENESVVDVQLNINGGYWYSPNGNWIEENTRRSSDKLDVVVGEKYLVTTKIGGSTVIAYLAQWNGATWVGVAEGFTGGSGDAIDKEYIVPEGVTQIAISSYDITVPSLKKVVEGKVANVYTKQEADSIFATKDDIPIIPYGKYGVKWSVSDYDDLGQRCFDAVGLTATIGEGNDDGSSDFDSIYPWSEMKRCNIKINANGAQIVTFEGESGFALDGSNGDVFVRIPKFKTDRYIDSDGKMCVVIGDGYVHPAFIEEGVELDEIFISAFEASKVGTALYSKAGVIPANTMTGAEFLAAAKERGANYSLYDMRCVDLLWRLMAVEFGCRNSNRILGYGYADYMQADSSYASGLLNVTQGATGTNTIVCGTITSNSMAVVLQTNFAVGNVVNISDTRQSNVVAQRKIVSVSAVNGQNLSITFDGEAIDVTTSMFVGNAPIFTNFCEGIATVSSNYALSWHTGRANRPSVSGSGIDIETINPCRYRWIENPVGNVWHNMPDITFKDRQMYVCKNMKDYEMLKYTTPYHPVGSLLPEQSSNGNKLDVNNSEHPNYWVTALLNDIFAKGNCFGKSFDTVHDGSITSKKGYGGYYYLYDNGTYYVCNGGGFDHLWRCNILTNRAWQNSTNKWFLYGARLMYKNLDGILPIE